MERAKSSPLGVYTMGIAGLFLLGFLLMVILGAQIYGDAVATQQRNNQTRALTAYLSTCLKDNDSAGALTLQRVGDTDVLVIADGTSGYALRIYQRDGLLLEDYAQAEDPLEPERAQTIGETACFSVEALPDGVWAITTDAGRSLIHTRSDGEAVP
jgi:hypothetical protein